MPSVTIWVPGWEDLEHWGSNTASILQGNDTYESNTMYNSLGMLIIILVPICVTILFRRQIFVCVLGDARASAGTPGDEEVMLLPYTVSTNQSQLGAPQELDVTIYSEEPSHCKKRNKSQRQIRGLKKQLRLVVALNKVLRTQVHIQKLDLETGSAECEILKHELKDSVAGTEALAQQLEDNNDLIDSLDERITIRDASINRLNNQLTRSEVALNNMKCQMAFWQTCIQKQRVKFRDVSKFADESFWAVVRMGRLANDLALLHLSFRVTTVVTEFQRIRDGIEVSRRQLITEG